MRVGLEEEFRQFAERAIPRLRRMAVALCRDPHRADDLVQTTLEKMYGAWPRVHGVEDPLAYARTVLVRALISEQRRHWWTRERSTPMPGSGSWHHRSGSTTGSTCGRPCAPCRRGNGWPWCCATSRTCR